MARVVRIFTPRPLTVPDRPMRTRTEYHVTGNSPIKVVVTMELHGMADSDGEILLGLYMTAI